MLRVTSRKTKRKNARVKYVGIVSDAATLGVTQQHLYLVLEGKRRSRSLLIRYQELQRKKAA